jgi:hypothetical protein
MVFSIIGDINANTDDISDTLIHYTARSHYVQQKRLLELKAHNWKK